MHELKIESYTLDELMGLLDLNSSQNVTMDDLKRAKKKVLMMHPDKSRLPKEYFLFYKKAFDIIYRLYDDVHKVSKPVEETVYTADKNDDGQSEQMRKQLGQMSSTDFHRQFHTLYEKHAKKPVNTEKYAWFSAEENAFGSLDHVRNVGQMNQAMDTIKQRQQEMTLYKGVKEMRYHGGNSFYQDIDGDDEEEDGSGIYVECDPFSKLKFDDVRKVHRDQTVIGVRESDYNQVPKYKNVDEYQRSRHAAGSVAPMGETQAQRLMAEQERFLQEKMRQKQYQAEQATMRNMEMNQQVMKNFLRLGNS